MNLGERMLLVAGCAAGYGLFLSTTGLVIAVVSVLQPPGGTTANQTHLLAPGVGVLSGVYALVQVFRRAPLSVEAAMKQAETSGQLEFRVWVTGLLGASFHFLMLLFVLRWWTAVSGDGPRAITDTIAFGDMGHVLGMGGAFASIFSMMLFSRWQGRHAEMTRSENLAASV